jgi:hypothetical protein
LRILKELAEQLIVVGAFSPGNEVVKRGGHFGESNLKRCA